MSISVVIVLKNINMIPLIIDNYNKIEYDNKNLIIVDDNKNSNIDKFIDIKDCIYIHLSDDDKKSFFEKIDAVDKQDINYSKIINRLPIGFMLVSTLICSFYFFY